MATYSPGGGRTHLKEEEQKHRRDKSNGRTGYKGGDNQVVYQEAFFPHNFNSWYFQSSDPVGAQQAPPAADPGHLSIDTFKAIEAITAILADTFKTAIASALFYRLVYFRF